MYYRLNPDGSLLDYSRGKYHEDCLYTEEEVVITHGGDAYLASNATAETIVDKHHRINTALSKYVQGWLDTKAQDLQYDNCNSACTYIDTGIPRYDSEGKAFRQWRSAVWNAYYEILAEAFAGERSIPTQEELIAELPELKIIYE